MTLDFSVNLPTLSCDVMTREDIPQTLGPGKKVMVVDDDEDFRMLLCARLERKGMDCFEAENGEVAKWQLSTHHVDLVVTDNHMPKMDGLTLINWLQEHQKYIPIIFVSGDLSAGIIEQIEQARVYYIFEKPCSLAKLSQKVEEALTIC
ncbi:MAG: hypothetical protein NPIRA01_32430 [Nitrospirales bacterium]|nr:MAG: hypothetical protein NPIRA01_32430 [Nitrospirales bacterium]